MLGDINLVIPALTFFILLLGFGESLLSPEETLAGIEECSPGEFFDGDNCVLCPAGSFCPDPSSPPVACVPGEHCPEGSEFPTPCPAGSFCSDPALSPVACTPGEHCPEGSISPIPCPAGSFCSDPALSPVACTPGEHCPEGSVSPTPCPAGSFCFDPALPPVACPSNFFCPEGSTSPTPCPDGETSPPGSSECSAILGPDEDNDGVIDELDKCPGTSPEDSVGVDGCPLFIGITINDLTDLILDIGLRTGKQMSMLDKVFSAQASIAEGDLTSAYHDLLALEKKIQGEIGKSLNESEAAFLIRAVAIVYTEISPIEVDCIIDDVFSKIKTSVCLELGGIIVSCIGTIKKFFSPKSPTIIRLTQFDNTNPGQLKDWVDKLEDDVFKSNVHKFPYIEKHFDCDDTAEHLEIRLTGMGYISTFTTVFCDPPNDGNRFTGHAIVDVHAPDGSVIWIEPQHEWTVYDLDYDMDGFVEVSSSPLKKGQNTDDKCRIAVYDSRIDAENSGAILD